MQACGARQDDRAELGRAMDEQPAGEAEAQALGHEHRIHGAEEHAVAGDQEEGGDGESEAERERQDRDLRIVREEIGGEYFEPALIGGVVKGRAEILGGGVHVTPARHFGRDECVEPGRIAGHEEIAGKRAGKEQRRDQQGLANNAAHRGGPAMGEEAADLPPERIAAAVEDEISAGGKALEIGGHRRVERGFARDRQR